MKSLNKKQMSDTLLNKEKSNINEEYKHCERCDLYKANKCPYAFKFQRLPRDQHGLGLCKKLKNK